MDMTTLKEDLETKVKASLKRKIALSILFDCDYEQYPPSGIYNYYVDRNVVKIKAASGQDLSKMINATTEVLKKHGYTVKIDKEENSTWRYFSRAHIYFE